MRVKDIDIERGVIVVRDGKGQKDRVTVLPSGLRPKLAAQLARQQSRCEQIAESKRGYVRLPHALARKHPNAPSEWAWQWVFPATRTYVDPADRLRYRTICMRLYYSAQFGTLPSVLALRNQ